MARSSGRWRDLPDRYGDYRAMKRRYYDWVERGVLGDILQTLSRDADLHSQAAGARKKKGGA